MFVQILYKSNVTVFFRNLDRDYPPWTITPQSPLLTTTHPKVLPLRLGHIVILFGNVFILITMFDCNHIFFCMKSVFSRNKDQYFFFVPRRRVGREWLYQHCKKSQQYVWHRNGRYLPVKQVNALAMHG